MSRGLGKLQRDILDALPAHEVEKHPGVYDLKKLRVALSQAMGRGQYVKGRYSREQNIWWPDYVFAACFSRAVHTLMTRGLLTPARPCDHFMCHDWGRWRLPYVQRTDKR
jgi:hypothetical protein